MSSAPRTALVTGGSRGIGAAITRALSARQLRVACTYRSSRDEAERICTELPVQALALPFQLGDPESAHSVVGSVLREWGRLDALVLNAGMWRGGRVDTLDPTQWWGVLEANVGGNAHLVRAALPALREGTNPSITFISSVVGLRGFAGDTAYGSAKAALIGFARSLAKELGRDGIRVNVLAPGYVETDMTAKLEPAQREAMLAAVPLGRPATADEIAASVLFLASNEAAYITGQVLAANGGMYM